MTEPYYSDDQVTLYNGDALAVLRDLPTGSVDAVVTDPPYSSGGQYRGDRTQSTTAKYVTTQNVTDKGVEFSGDNRDQRGYAYWCALWLSEALRVTKVGGLCLLFTDWRQLPSTTDALQSGGWIWRGVIPWVKPNARPTAGRFTNAAEYVAWGSSGPLGYDYRDDVFPGFYQANPPRQREHQTQKPLDVMRGLISAVPRGGVVLDPFMGSGTTGVASVLDGRHFVGAEVHDHHAATAERRIREAQGQAVPKGEQLALGEVAS